jgi:cysteine desulfurase
MKLPIYLDYAATTPVDPRVAEKMMQHMTMDGVFGNPASRSHRYGWQAEEAVDVARNQVADLINAITVKLFSHQVRQSQVTLRLKVLPIFIIKRASTSSPVKLNIKQR